MPKVEKEDYSIAKSYGPISLMKYLLKGLERLSVWVTDTSLKDNSRHIKQHGFQKGKVQKEPYPTLCTKWKSIY